MSYQIEPGDFEQYLVARLLHKLMGEESVETTYDYNVCRVAIYDFINQYPELGKYNLDKLIRGFMYLRDHVRSSTPATSMKEPTVPMLCMLLEGMGTSRQGTYRISIKPASVEMLHLGLDSVIDADEHTVYSSVDALPKWVQERLATLMMMKYTPPTEEVAGVGKRIAKTIFWVFKPQDSDTTSVSV